MAPDTIKYEEIGFSTEDDSKPEKKPQVSLLESETGAVTNDVYFKNCFERVDWFTVWWRFTFLF